MAQQNVEDDDISVLGGIMARRVSERVARVRLGAERQQLVKAGHLVTQHGEVERRASESGRRQVNVALHVVQVLQHPGVALHTVQPGPIHKGSSAFPVFIHPAETRTILISRIRAPTSATQPSWQMDLESGTICRRDSDSRTCHTVISVSRRRRFYMVSGTRAYAL